MAKINKKQRFILYVLIVVSLIGGYVYFVFLPKEKDIVSLIQDKINKETQLRKAAIQAKNQDRLTKEIADLEEKLTQVKMQLPKEKEIPDLLKNIDAKGLEANIDFLYFKPQPIIPKEFYGEVPITLNVKGRFHNLGFFLNKLAGLHRLLSVSNLKINSITEKDEKVTVRADIIVKSYIYMEGQK